MPKLILDLDKTTLAIGSDAHEIDSFHKLEKIDSETQRKINKIIKGEVSIINPKELTWLIELAYRQYDGLMILTSGCCWTKDHIIQLFRKNLELLPATARRLEELEFHSPNTDLLYFREYPLNTKKEYHDAANNIARLTKDERLRRIFKSNPTMDMRYVMIDDSHTHYESLKSMDNVTPILATTNYDDKYFYNDAENALAANAILEARDALFQPPAKDCKPPPTCSMKDNKFAMFSKKEVFSVDSSAPPLLFARG
jgi:hypothetical protein